MVRKRLSTRLAELEAASTSPSLPPEDSKLLVTILARRDALAWPWRFQICSTTPFCEIRTRWQEYLGGKVGISVKADGASSWKSASEQRQRLIAGGYLTANHSSGQVQSVFLTPTGEGTARGLVGYRLQTLHTCLCRGVLERLRRLSTATDFRAVRESILWNHVCAGCPNDWDHLTELVLPLISSGIVRAVSDTQGRAAYVPVDGIKEPEDIKVDVQASDEMDSLYCKTFNNERSFLETVEPRDPLALIIPEPATGWGWPCHFPEGALS